MGIWDDLFVVPLEWSPVIQRFLCSLIISRFVQLLTAGVVAFHLVYFEWKEQKKIQLVLAKVNTKIRRESAVLQKRSVELTRRQDTLEYLLPQALYQEQADIQEVQNEMVSTMARVHQLEPLASSDHECDFLNRIYQAIVHNDSSLGQVITQAKLKGLADLIAAIKNCRSESLISQVLEKRKDLASVFLRSLELPTVLGDSKDDDNLIVQLLVTPGGIFILEAKNWGSLLLNDCVSRVNVSLTSKGYLCFNYGNSQRRYYPLDGPSLVEQVNQHVQAIKQLLLQNDLWDCAKYIHPVIILTNKDYRFHVKNYQRQGDPYLTTINTLVDYVYDNREPVLSKDDIQRIQRVILAGRTQHKKEQHLFTFVEPNEELLHALYGDNENDPDFLLLRDEVRGLQRKVVKLQRRAEDLKERVRH